MTTDPIVTFFSALFFEPTAIYEVASLIRAEDFPQDDHRHTFASMLELANGGLPIDIAHVWDRLKARGYNEPRACEVLERLTDGTPIAGNVRRYARLMRKSFRKRRLTIIAEAVLRRAEDNVDVDDVVREMQAELWELQSDRPEGGPVAARDFIPSFLDQAVAEREWLEELAGLPTGIAPIDDLTTGLRPGELWMVGALPGRGKTAFGTQVVVNSVNRGVPVCVFSHELTKNELARRIFGQDFGVCSMRTLRDLSPRAWNEVLEHARELSTLPLYVDDSASLTAAELSARARSAVRERGIKLIVVDYLQLLRGPEREIRERVGNAANILRQLAKDTQVPVLALSQLRRPNSLNDRPTMLDLKESGDIEAHAHTVLLLYQPMSDSTPTGEDEIIIGKQRNGPLGVVPVHFDTRTLVFRPRTLVSSAQKDR